MAITTQQIIDAYKQTVGAGKMTEGEFVNKAVNEYKLSFDQLNEARNVLLGKPASPPPTGGQTGVVTSTIDPSQSTLSPNFAKYVNRLLAKGEQAANLPYKPYTGDRYVGPSDLQETAFDIAKDLSDPTAFATAEDLLTKAGAAAGNLSYAPTTFDTGLGQVKSVEDYMSPYMGGVTDILAREARREADIARNAEQARLAQAGAYGGSRQAIMEAERQRNLGTQIEDIRTKGLQAAYDRALKQRLDEATLGLEAQKGTEGSKQFGAEFGLKGLDLQRTAGSGLGTLGAQQGQFGLDALKTQLSAGETQRQIAQQPLDFAYEQFQESMNYPYKQATFMHGLLGGMPLRANAYDSGTSSMSGILQGLLLGSGLSANIYGKPA